MYKRIAPFIALVLFLHGSVQSQDIKKPNIILIVADDLGWGDVGYHGSDIRTPSIDQLAKEGVELNRFYTAAVCSPTRAGLMTGRYPDRFGLRTVIAPWSAFGVDTNEMFLPQALAQAGYTNRALIGKWHLGHASAAYHPLSRGFTHFYGHLNGNIDYFTHEREGELDWHNDWKSSYDTGYSTDLLADEAIRCMTAYSKQSPFFLYLAFNAPHTPLQAKKEDLLKYGYDETKPTFGNGANDREKGRGNTKRQTYAAMVSCVDENIGRVLKALRELGLEENTIVLFQSDNGAEINEGGSSGALRGKKGTEWEGGVRAPAIIRWPAGLKGGRVVDEVMGYIDVMPTMLDAAGFTTKPVNALDGLSMLPVLRGQQSGANRSIYLGAGVIVNRDWKLVQAAEASKNMGISEDQFFNISKDPSEKSSLAIAGKDKNYTSLKKEISVYNNIRAAKIAPPYNVGKKGFVVPKEWTVDPKQ